MPRKGEAFTLTYTAWNTSNQEGQINDHGNHTLRWIKDGVPAEPSNAPTQVDATIARGEYNLVLTDDEANGFFGKLAGISSTTNVVIIPIAIPLIRHQVGQY